MTKKMGSSSASLPSSSRSETKLSTPLDNADDRALLDAQHWDAMFATLRGEYRPPGGSAEGVTAGSEAPG